MEEELKKLNNIFRVFHLRYEVIGKVRRLIKFIKKIEEIEDEKIWKKYQLFQNNYVSPIDLLEGDFSLIKFYNCKDLNFMNIIENMDDISKYKIEYIRNNVGIIFIDYLIENKIINPEFNLIDKRGENWELKLENNLESENETEINYEWKINKI